MYLYDNSQVKIFAPCFLVLFELGWSLYTAGFALALHREEGVLPATSSLLLPYYPTAVGGQLVAAVVLLRIVFPSSPVICALSTVLNTIYFAFVGYAIVASQFVTLSVSDNKVMFVGAVLLTISWGFLQLVFVLAKPTKQQQTGCCPSVCRPPVSPSSCWVRWPHCIAVGAENVRVFSTLAIILSATGWVISLKGLHNATPNVDGHVFMEWTATYLSPVLYIAALIHAGSSGKVGKMAHIVATVLNTFFTVSMGYMVISSGGFLCCYQDIRNSTHHLLTGGLICLTFWTIACVLWPFYHILWREQMRQGYSNRQCKLPPGIPGGMPCEL